MLDRRWDGARLKLYTVTKNGEQRQPVRLCDVPHTVSLPWGAVKSSSGKTATSPLGLTLGCVVK